MEGLSGTDGIGIELLELEIVKHDLIHLDRRGFLQMLPFSFVPFCARHFRPGMNSYLFLCVMADGDLW